jgi:tetratricopeptide (TPR) repeat protein
VQAGRADRARLAAERLFGLRLDSPTQVQLAAQMHQLGMHDLADAVLARARRQVGNSPAALLELMAQYRRQGNLDAASQIAVDVLRRSTGQALRLGLVDDPAQKQALDVLAASGKLNEMIAKVEGQVKTSPGSLPLRQALAAYYRAAGRIDKLKETNEAILKLRPDDTALRMQVATQLAQAGDLDAALDHYRAVFRHDPAMLSTYSAAIFATFQQANKTDELVKLLDHVGLKNFISPVPILNLLGPMLKDPKTFDQGSALFTRAWQAFPNDRATLLIAATTVAPFWARPDAYDLARGVVLPRADANSVEPWAGIGETITVYEYGADGDVTTPTTRLLDAATRLGKLDDLAGLIEARLARLPGWRGGSALLAATRLRQGKVDEGRAILERLLADPDARPPYDALMVLGQEARHLPASGPLAVALYDRAVKTYRALIIASLFMKPSAVRHLALLDRQAGRPAEALALARQAEEGLRVANGSGTVAVTTSYRTVNSLSGLGGLYLELGDHANALRVYDELLGLTDDIQAARGFATRDVYPTVDSMLAPAREGVARALDGLTRETLPLTLETLIKAGDAARPVDLRLAIAPREVDKATVRSLLASALDLASRDPATLAKVKADLDAILKGRPGDFEARSAVALAADPGALATAVLVLDRLADESHLPPIAPGARPVARVRDEAARRLGLWPVARRCWEHDSTAEVGDRLAAKALDAARHLPDPAWAMAMLRELGRRTLDRGDRPAAEARLADLLALIQRDPLAQAPPAAPPGRPTPAGNARPRVPAYTVDRFRQAAEFAALAAESGMADLSLRAVRDSLKGGPPVVPVALSREPATVVRATTATVEAPPDPTIVLVESKLVALDALWSKANVPPSTVYETLRDVVFPAIRPIEIFPYDPALTRSTRPSLADAPVPPGEVARLLARRAKAAGKLDELRKKLDERKGSPPARDAARRLLAAIEETGKAP